MEVEIREILLKDKPCHMLQASPKGTVPVLILPSGEVIDESLDICIRALDEAHTNRIDHELNWGLLSQIDSNQLSLIQRNDNEFKYWLDRYKYHVGHPDHSQEYYRSHAEHFLSDLNQLLHKNKNLISDQASLADLSIFPFVRQFAFVDKSWFDISEYYYLRNWLERWIDSTEFSSVMTKIPLWVE